MENFTIGQQVRVTFGKIGQEPMVFDSEIVDIVDNHRQQGVWVDHPECRGEDMMFINLSNPNINKVVVILEETTLDEIADRHTVKEIEMKEAKKAIQKAFKWEEDDITVRVKIYDCWDNYDQGQQSYDVEIQWGIGDEQYTDCVVVDSFYSNLRDDEVSLKDAKKRATAVLRTVKGWFDGSDQVTVENGVEVYHA